MSPKIIPCLPCPCRGKGRKKRESFRPLSSFGSCSIRFWLLSAHPNNTLLIIPRTIENAEFQAFNGNVAWFIALPLKPSFPIDLL